MIFVFIFSYRSNSNIYVHNHLIVFDGVVSFLQNSQEHSIILYLWQKHTDIRAQAHD